jgi:hypothetical protein
VSHALYVCASCAERSVVGRQLPAFALPAQPSVLLRVALFPKVLIAEGLGYRVNATSGWPLRVVGLWAFVLTQSLVTRPGKEHCVTITVTSTLRGQSSRLSALCRGGQVALRTVVCFLHVQGRRAVETCLLCVEHAAWDRGAGVR